MIIDVIVCVIISISISCVINSCIMCIVIRRLEARVTNGRADRCSHWRVPARADVMASAHAIARIERNGNEQAYNNKVLVDTEELPRRTPVAPPTVKYCRNIRAQMMLNAD